MERATRSQLTTHYSGWLTGFVGWRALFWHRAAVASPPPPRTRAGGCYTVSMILNSRREEEKEAAGGCFASTSSILTSNFPQAPICDRTSPILSQGISERKERRCGRLFRFHLLCILCCKPPRAPPRNNASPTPCQSIGEGKRP